jgi:holo-[acyl-carrier protein] synthase
MIVGVGADIVRVSRMAGIFEDHGLAFEKRCFSEAERSLLPDDSARAAGAASLFAAKEALLKCLDAGILKFPLTELEILKREEETLEVRLSGAAEERRKQLRIGKIRVDTSCDGDYAVAFAVAEGGDE